MIEELRIHNLALIEKVQMNFGPGFTVLTGETGAGKSALLGGIKLAIGVRSDASLVREGCKEALVEAAFSVDDSEARAVIEQSGFSVEEDGVIVKRRISLDGRSKCYINDEIASVKGLSQTIGPLVDLHGQHEQQNLLSPNMHVEYLDRWAGDKIQPLKDEYKEAFYAYRKAKAALDEASDRASASEYQVEQARFVCSQIDPVNPGEGELDELESKLPILRNGESLAMSAAQALETLRKDGGVIDMLSCAMQELERTSNTDPKLDSLSMRLEENIAQLEDLGQDFRQYRDDVEFDPESLEKAMDRLGQLDGLVRRFGPTYEAMLDRWNESREILESLDNGSSVIAQLENETSKAKEHLLVCARNLEEARTNLGREFCEKLSSSVAQLAMQGCKFEIKQTELDLDTWTSTGSRRYELMYAPGARLTPRSLFKIASGGELSRVMLAIECMGEMQSSKKTMVFDEIDAGIGGEAANAVAAKLVELSKRHQVIVVTHLAQIAARANNHLLVLKEMAQGQPKTTINLIDGDDRVSEIARMLSGTTDDSALEHAKTMLEQQSSVNCAEQVN